MGIRLDADYEGDGREGDVHLNVLLLLVVEEAELLGAEAGDGVAVTVVNPGGRRHVFDAVDEAQFRLVLGGWWRRLLRHEQAAEKGGANESKHSTPAGQPHVPSALGASPARAAPIPR